MSQNNPNRDNKNEKKNNFFNQNPLLMFAIFAIVIILVFKNFTAMSDSGMEAGFGTQNSATKNIS